MTSVNPLKGQTLLVFSLAALCLTALCLSCSKKSAPTQSDNLSSEVLQPNPDGMLLPGAATANAYSSQVDLPPSPASEADIEEDGLMDTRLEAVIADTATIGEVNAVLQAHSATIVSMLKTAPLITLKTLKLSGKGSVDSLAALLEGSGAFSFVFPSYVVEPEPADSTGSTMLAKIAPGGSADGEIIHLTELKMPAAWNVKDMIPSSSITSVLVPDDYLQSSIHTEIPAQTFITGGTNSLIQRHGVFEGNHGYHVCGIIGAAFDSTLATGVHPSAGTNLDILSLPLGGFTWNDVGLDIATQIADHMPSGKFVLNTSLGYNDPGFAHFSQLHRAFLMLNWRARVARVQDRFLHATAAGNDGLGSGDSKLASFNSPFCSAARFVHSHDMLTGAGLTPAQITTVDRHYAKVIAIVPEAANPLHNVVIVGNNDVSGSEVPGSNKRPDVHCVGEMVYSTCVQADPGFPPSLAIGCKGSDGWYSGTSMAAPQVAGLAAYLWGIKPSLAVADLVDIILRSDLNGQVDAYAAVQQLDLSLASPAVRMHLLDVANTSDQEAPDGQFTEHDLAMYLSKFQFFEQQRGGSLFTKDYSRYDLDGNGFTGDTISKDGIFDLDVDNPQAFGTATQTMCDGTVSFDETHLTDYEILKYYAYSNLYVGDTTERSVLIPCEAEGVVHLLSESAFTWSATGKVPLATDIHVTDSVMSRKEVVSTSFAAESQESSCNNYFLHSSSEQSVTYVPGVNNTTFSSITGFVTSSLDGTLIGADTCKIMTVAASRHVDSIQVRNHPLDFTLSLTRTSPIGFTNVHFWLVSSNGFSVIDSSASGTLQPGTYLLQFETIGSITWNQNLSNYGTCRIDFTLTFHAQPPASLKEDKNMRSQR